MIEPWTLVCFVAILVTREKQVWEVEEKRVLGRQRGWQVVGVEPSGCYFLALAALAEFRGGVTGLPDPIPPPPP